MPYNVVVSKYTKINGKYRNVGETAENVKDELFDELNRRGLVESFVEVAEEGQQGADGNDGDQQLNNDDLTDGSQQGDGTEQTTLLDGDTNGDGKLTIDEIKALLDARNIDYKGVRLRDELLALLEQSEAGE